MAIEEGPRRSGRARKQIKTLAGEQADAAELAAATQPARKKRKVTCGDTQGFQNHNQAVALGSEEGARHDDCPCEELLIAGSRGTIYTVRISHIVTCNCPVSIFEKKGSEGHCKHILYALHTVLRVPHHLQYRQSFLHSELKELFANSPALPSQIAEQSEKDGNRKDTDGECPICFMDFEEGDDLVWCKAACGNNLHAQCFKQWEKSKNPVTCPFCRTRWQGDVKGKQKATVTEVNMPMERGKGGYYNVADQLAY